MTLRINDVEKLDNYESNDSKGTEPRKKIS